jgi:hypothetical protein
MSNSTLIRGTEVHPPHASGDAEHAAAQATAPLAEPPSCAAPAPHVSPPVVVVDIVLPVNNEEADLGRNVLRLHEYLEGQSAFGFRITIADNASTDGTWAVAQRLAEDIPGVTALHFDEKGRGRALKAAWSRSDAAVLAYMDIDLSTDLAALLPLVAPLVSGHSDLAIGTRLSRSAVVHRGRKREFISRSYNRLTRLALRSRFSDAQCGFKAIRANRARAVLPWIEDDGWFFDTELLVVAERAGLRIHEAPVDWTDDADSRVDIVPTAIADLRGIPRCAAPWRPASCRSRTWVGGSPAPDSAPDSALDSAPDSALDSAPRPREQPPPTAPWGPSRTAECGTAGSSGSSSASA